LNYQKVFNSGYNLQLDILPWQQLFAKDQLRRGSVKSLETLIEVSSKTNSVSMNSDDKDLM
jgi:hypothetical protein